MLKNYFKIAWRNLFRHKGFATSNLLGLTIGMTCSILIFLWVHDELAYDRCHRNYDNIYQVIANRDFKNHVFTDKNMVFPLAKSLNSGFSNIKYAVEMTYPEDHIFQYGETKVKKNGYTVSEHFFDVFTWKFLRGDAATAITAPNSIVLTESAARAFFGKEDPVNKILRVDNDVNMKVTGVVADPPDNSTFKFDFVRLFNYSGMQREMAEWQNSSWNVFVQVTPGSSPALLEKEANEVMRSHNQDKISTYFAFPMNKWRLYSDFKDGKNAGGMIEYVRLFTGIAIIILLIACINFMNLSTARSEKRAKEVGIRKTLGSDRRQLRWQFLFESIILTCIAFFFSMVLVLALLPAFNTMVGKHLEIHPGDPVFWAGVIGIIVFTGVVAGSYPAFYLSSFNPVKVLKGTFLAGRKAVLPRRILVVGQFVISILLISATIIVYRQLQYVKNRDLGYNPDNLIMMPQSEDLGKNYTALKQDLLGTGMVASVTRTLSPVTDIWWRSPSPDWDERPAGTDIIFCGQAADKDYTKTLGVKMLEGQDFSGMPVDSGTMLLNKAAVDAMHLTHPVGHVLRYGRRKFTVIGVTENVVMESPYKPVDPLMIYYQPGNTATISIRLNRTASPQKAIAAMEPLVKKYSPSSVFDYSFVDREFGKKFLTEELISRITDIFAGLAIFICCLGLAGLASFTIEKRIREIGIRKVLGASVMQLLALISKEFLRLVLLAFIIAVPLTWWAMSNWLEKYTFRISINPWIFVLVGGVILLLTLVVVGLNTVRAAVRNPTKSLRTE
ncbi:ABC transporter permease [Flavitalea sp. BT771]|uniref:ABC transporter permease n=1 Tax=Flavitalea sp. BT771 TaxID=3063329 RepID=UPI0026E13C37|nr:ABC transporter permease [Flavitalea sp. BT771]MDO6431623.1 ABC transporter permease [Flavitalea sp. BT771]MDV6220531.1 ABC transporter permease [Flavitalea sp. BT771]